MPVPRRRHGRTRQAKRRSHIKLIAKQLVSCEKCGEPKMRHRVCPSCGTYKGVQYTKVSEPKASA